MERKELKEKIKKNENGITLIALVITIIVLLILAGVSIATLLGENGILSQANKAKVETRGATVEEECNLWKINKGMDSQTAQETAQTLEGLLDSLEERNLITAEERATIEETGDITIGSRTIEFGKEEPTVEHVQVGVKVTGGNKPYIDADGDKAIIPEGFIIVPGCEDVSKGLVISDNEGDTEEIGKPQIVEGNQFVWVPVENFDEFKREAGYQGGVQQTCTFVSDKLTDGKYYESEGNVKSTLCYGVQWDAVMRWMSDVDNPNVTNDDGSNKAYIQDSTGMGWYSNNSGSNVKNTGTDIENGKNKIKNIYDMSGNVYEWTMEASNTTYRVYRGGNFSINASNNPASNRVSYYPSTAYITIGFRLALYLKDSN